MSRSAIIFICVLLLIVVFASVFTWWVTRSDESSQMASALSARDDVRPFTNVSGEEISLDRVLATNQVVVVTTWASWCPGCQEQLLTLDRLAGEFASDVIVLAINRAESTSRAQRFLENIPELSNLELVFDPDDRFFRDVAGYTMPEIVVYNRNQSIYTHHHGVISYDDMSDVLRGAVAQ